METSHSSSVEVEEQQKTDATAEIERLVERRSKHDDARAQANAQEAAQRAREQRRLEARRAFNLELWEEHYCNQYRFHVKQAREAARKYKALRNAK